LPIIPTTPTTAAVVGPALEVEDYKDLGSKDMVLLRVNDNGLFGSFFKYFYVFFIHGEFSDFWRSSL